jgi:ABC-type uncharacterized transport system permease subunit
MRAWMPQPESKLWRMILSSAPSAPLGLQWGVAVFAATFVCYVLAALPNERAGAWASRALSAGWLLHAFTVALDTVQVEADGHFSARFGFAPVLSATVWLVLAVYLVESRLLPLPRMRRVFALLGAGVVLLSFVFPGEIRAPDASPWAPLHWLLGVASYGLFGAAVLHASLLDSAERRMRSKKNGANGSTAPLGLPLLRLERLTFGFVDAGFVVLTAAIAVGWSFTEHWRWTDRKAIFSLLGWIVFAALLVGRHVSGWRGRRATRWRYVGASLLLLAYIGSRFVFEVLLHRQPA